MFKTCKNHLSVYLSACLPVCVPVCLSVHLTSFITPYSMNSVAPPQTPPYSPLHSAPLPSKDGEGLAPPRLWEEGARGVWGGGGRGTLFIESGVGVCI